MSVRHNLENDFEIVKQTAPLKKNSFALKDFNLHVFKEHHPDNSCLMEICFHIVCTDIYLVYV